MAAIEDLIRQIADPRLRDQLAAEVAKLKNQKKFGLVFEDHLPELLRLPQVAATVGARVVRKDDHAGVTYRVTAEVNGKWIKAVPESGGPEEKLERSAIVVAKAFGEPMYPALIPVDAIERAPGKPWHVLINADNYHALQLLLYGYEGKVDCIYIDPPYNTGARDWKYNNDYVEAEDQFRHSKWLSMMKKRLEIAKRLIKKDGVLICTIDEHEVHHLGTLLETLFPECVRQMATIVINAKGVSQGRLARVEEYALFAFNPDAYIVSYHDDLLSPDRSNAKRFQTPRWEWLLRGGNNSRREDRYGLFYPIYVDPKTKRITGVGDPLPKNLEPDRSDLFEGSVAWPIRTDGSFGNWQAKPETLRQLADAGFVRLGGFDKKRLTWTVQYLNRGTRKRMEAGEIVTTGRDPVTGAVEIAYSGEHARKRSIKTVWHRGAHDSGIYGSSVLKNMVPGASFAFPKSVYAVRDALASVIRNRPNAIVLDFFAGSGTTMNATALLNAEDGGKRQCILATNNEVGAEKSSQLAAAGFVVGSDEWELNGIAASVTWPRIRACITGKRADGTNIPGEYLDGRPIVEGFEENAAYFKLDFLDPAEVNRGDKFESIVPILWMLAGCRGAPEVSRGSGKWFIPKASPFAVLLKEDEFGGFRKAIEKKGDIEIAFLVTDSADHFHRMRSALGKRYRCIQLYRSYIDTFRINLSEPGTISASGVPVQLAPAASAASATGGKGA